MRQNLAFAFTVMAVLMVLAIFGNIALPLGVVGHEGSTLVVVANGLRLLIRQAVSFLDTASCGMVTHCGHPFPMPMPEAAYTEIRVSPVDGEINIHDRR